MPSWWLLPLSGTDFDLRIQFFVGHAFAYFIVLAILTMAGALIAIQSLPHEFRFLRNALGAARMLALRLSVLLACILFFGRILFYFFYCIAESAWSRGQVVSIAIQPFSQAMMWTGSVGLLLSGTWLFIRQVANHQRRLIATLENRCHQCGHSVAAETNRCTECGEPHWPENPTRPIRTPALTDRLVLAARWIVLAASLFLWTAPRTFGSAFWSTALPPTSSWFWPRRLTLIAIQPFFWMGDSNSMRWWIDEL